MNDLFVIKDEKIILNLLEKFKENEPTPQIYYIEENNNKKKEV